MFKLIIASLLISSTSFASTLMLKKHTSSGYVNPEFSFTKDCRIYKEGFARTKIIKASRPPVYHTYYFSRHTTAITLGLLAIAKTGTISELPTLCDAGDKILDGYLFRRKIILDDDKDCASHKINNSPVVPQLQEIASTICHF